MTDDALFTSTPYRPVEPAPPAAHGNGADAAQPLPKLIPIRFVEGEVIPPREWIAPNWIPQGTVTLVQGNGGDGKTPLMQQLQSSCATALPWIGLCVEECVSVGFYTEDKERDLKERQLAIDAAYGLVCAKASSKMHLFPRLGQENELVEFDGVGKPKLTKFYHQVHEAAFDFHAKLIVLDVLVDLFGGDEIKRRQVRAFMRPLLGLAAERDAAVVLTSHVSQAGIQSDGGHSGSTDWSNAVRSRLYLSRPREDKETGPADTSERLLTRKKANFASIGDTIKLRWDKGLLLPEERMPSYFRRSPEDVFLALLDEHYAANRQPLSESKNASNFAPKVFGSAPANLRNGHGCGDFRRAMEALFNSRKIISVPYGRRGDERRRIARNVDLHNDKDEQQQ